MAKSLTDMMAKGKKKMMVLMAEPLAETLAKVAR
jgi:hypothetical protein